jgi:pSer/pThr/pTyr-binding forkhead associated (FHA) protein
MTEGTVSREHVRLAPEGGGWRLQKLSQRAPVYLNGRPVDEASLAPGDQIQVGTSVLVFETA